MYVYDCYSTNVLDYRPRAGYTQSLKQIIIIIIIIITILININNNNNNNNNSTNLVIRIPGVRKPGFWEHIFSRGAKNTRTVPVQDPTHRQRGTLCRQQGLGGRRKGGNTETGIHVYHNNFIYDNFNLSLYIIISKDIYIYIYIIVIGASNSNRVIYIIVVVIYIYTYTSFQRVYRKTLQISEIHACTGPRLQASQGSIFALGYYNLAATSAIVTWQCEAFDGGQPPYHLLMQTAPPPADDDLGVV